MQHKSQQIEVCNSRISRLSEEVKVLSDSLQKKQAAVTQLENELQSYQKAATTTKQLSDVIALTTEIVKLKQRLQEAEYQKQQITLEKDAALQEVVAKKKVEMQLHRHLGKVVVKIIIHTRGWYTDKPHCSFNYLQMSLPRSLTTLKALGMLSWMKL